MSASSVKPLNVQLPAITLILFALCVGIFCYLAQWMSYEESINPHSSISVLALLLSRCRVNPGAYLAVSFCSSFSHLLMNMFALLVVRGSGGTDTGKMATSDYLVILRHVFGGLISACYALRDSDQIVISVGASGAIMPE